MAELAAFSNNSLLRPLPHQSRLNAPPALSNLAMAQSSSKGQRSDVVGQLHVKLHCSWRSIFHSLGVLPSHPTSSRQRGKSRPTRDLPAARHRVVELLTTRVTTDRHWAQKISHFSLGPGSHHSTSHPAKFNTLRTQNESNVESSIESSVGSSDQRPDGKRYQMKPRTHGSNLTSVGEKRPSRMSGHRWECH